MCPLLKAFETRGAREQTTKVRRRAFSLLTIMSRAQRQRARTEMWQSNYGTETRGRPRVRSAWVPVRGVVRLSGRCVRSRNTVTNAYSGTRTVLHRTRSNTYYTQAFSFLRAGCGGIRTQRVHSHVAARTHARV